jgi:hypothetical protein
MALANCILDGAGATATLGSTSITDINSIGFSVAGERPEINLTTIGDTKWKTKLLGALQKVQDIVINCKSNPTLINSLYSTSSEALVIAYKLSKTTTKNITFYAQFKGASASSLERAPGDGVNVDLNFYVTNLSGTTETGPAITAP